VPRGAEGEARAGADLPFSFFKGTTRGTMRFFGLLAQTPHLAEQEAPLTLVPERRLFL